MSGALERHLRECNEMRLAGMIWWLILWYASDGGEVYIPSEQGWLSCELGATIVEEVTGEKQWYSWRHDEFDRECHHDWREWPEMVNAKLENCERHNHSAFDGSKPKSMVLGLLKRFVRYRLEYGRSDMWYGSDLKVFHEHTTPIISGRSTFRPHREMYNRAMAYLRDHGSILGFDQVELLTDWIGRLGMMVMRPYVDRDVAYIKKNYQW